jgi:hypothetical protein
VSRSIGAGLGLRAEFRMAGSFPVIRGFLLTSEDFGLGGGLM